MSNSDDLTSEAARLLGKKGGEAGTGDAKRRSHEHYSKASKKRWDAYKAKQGNNEKPNTEPEKDNDNGTPTTE